MGILFINGTVLDGRGGSLERAFVAVEGDRIASVGQEFSGPTRGYTEVHDLTGHTLLPGLIDCHVHLTSDSGPDPVAQVMADSEGMAALRAARNARVTLQAGLTTVRDCGAKTEVMITVRRAVDAGLIDGPRIMASGMAICMTGGHGWWCGLEADGPEGLRVAARRQLKAGADFIKLIATGGIMTPGVEVGVHQLDEEEMAAAVREARKAGKRVAAHAHGADGVKAAVRAGVTSVEHGFFMDDEAIEMLLLKGVYLVPTTATIRVAIEKGVQAGVAEYVIAKSEQALPHQERSFKAALAAGVKMTMGTDAGMPFNCHGDNAQELTMMVGLGMSPMDAIVSSTSRAAELLGLQDRLGSVVPGMLADLLVVEGNPLEEIGLLQKRDRIALVLKGGKVVAGKGIK